MNFYKEEPGNVIGWAIEDDEDGEFPFTFDGNTIFNFWTDYPWKLTREQKKIFDRENPVLAELKSDEGNEYDKRYGNS